MYANAELSNGNEQRSIKKGTLVGILLWAAWVAGISVLIMLVTNINFSASLSSDQVLEWTIFGPLLIFVLAGRYLMDAGHLIDYRRYDLNNLSLSAVLFFLWSLVNLACYVLNVNLSLDVNVIGGWIIGYLALVAHNKVLMV